VSLLCLVYYNNNWYLICPASRAPMSSGRCVRWRRTDGRTDDGGWTHSRKEIKIIIIIIVKKPFTPRATISPKQVSARVPPATASLRAQAQRPEKPSRLRPLIIIWGEFFANHPSRRWFTLVNPHFFRRFLVT